MNGIATRTEERVRIWLARRITSVRSRCMCTTFSINPSRHIFK